MHLSASGTVGCARRTIERTRYFTGQLLDDADLTQEQLYFREKARRHNRMLHGWGIVCGLCVRPGVGCELIVESGYALDPYGDEIVVEDEVTVDLCSEDDDGNAVPPCPHQTMSSGNESARRGLASPSTSPSGTRSA